MDNDTNLSIRHYFEGLYATKKQVAKCRALSCIVLLNLPNLDPSRRVLKIILEMDLLQVKTNAFCRKEYVTFADDLPHLFNYFSGHLYFCRHNEEEMLLEGLVLSETAHLFSRLLVEAKAQLPYFGWANFMNNELNVVFYELNQQPWGTSLEEYTAMRYWQAQRKLECVDLQSGHWVARFMESVRGLPGNLELFHAEWDQVGFLLENAAHITPGELITRFSNLRACLPDSMPENAMEFHARFCQFVQGHAMPTALSPGSLQLAMDTIQAGKIALAPVFGWALIKYKKWLGDVWQGTIR